MAEHLQRVRVQQSTAGTKRRGQRNHSDYPADARRHRRATTVDATQRRAGYGNNSGNAMCFSTTAAPGCPDAPARSAGTKQYWSLVMSLNADQLFPLLPAVYRTRDAANGNPLQAFFAVLAAQSDVVEENIQQLYDDQFIETCAQWVIPYIGDLIGYNSIYEVASSNFDSRAEVANTIGYRRRKGTLLALEQLAMDVSGRPAVAVEEFRRLITTESMRLVRPHHGATVNLRNISKLDKLSTAFDKENRTIDVRRIAPRLRLAADPDPTPLDISLHGPGRFNIPDIAIHLWRWRSWPVVNAPATVVGGGRYMFSPLGHNIALFSQPHARSSFSSLTTRIDVPQPLSLIHL